MAHDRPRQRRRGQNHPPQTCVRVDKAATNRDHQVYLARRRTNGQKITNSQRLDRCENRVIEKFENPLAKSSAQRIIRRCLGIETRVQQHIAHKAYTIKTAHRVTAMQAEWNAQMLQSPRRYLRSEILAHRIIRHRGNASGDRYPEDMARREN